MDSIISIIIPVYKVENSIVKCIDSVLSQTYINWELLLVDDGSPDNSGKICDKYAKQDFRIKVFHVENGGPSNARNVGLDNASGKYVCFIDSDDWVEPTYLEHLHNGTHNEGRGVVVAGHIRDYGDKHINKCVGNFFYDIHDMHKMFDERKICNWGYPHGKLFDLAVLKEHNIKFPFNVKFSEDLVLFLDYLRHVDWVCFISDCDYHYVFQEGGLLTSYNSYESEYEGFYLCNKYFHELAEISNASEEEMRSSYEWMSYMFMRSVKTMYRKGKNFKGLRDRLQVLKAIPISCYSFANEYKSIGLFIDKMSLPLLCKKCFYTADMLLMCFFMLRNLRK